MSAVARGQAHALRRRDELEFLPAALEILETPASPAGRAIAATICLFLVGALVWSILGRVDIVATAQGTVIPAGKSKVVQPLDAGVVTSILVRDGDHVSAGQVLVTLDATEAVAERDRIARDLWQARLDVAGLEALREGLGTSGGLGSFTPPPGAPAELAATERARIAARLAEQWAKLAGLAQQVSEKRDEMGENQAQIEKLAASLPFLAQKRAMYRALLQEHLTNRPDWLDSEQEYSDQAHQIVVQLQHARTLGADVAALQGQQDETQFSYANGVLKDLADALQKAADLSREFTAAAHRAAQTVLRAPIGGTVQQLAVHSVDGVVTPAEKLMTIVPDDAPVLVEAMVDNRDVGFVHPGQAVAVKVEAFNFTRYGLLHGHVVVVSPDSVADDAVPPQQQYPAGAGAASPGAGQGSETSVYLVHIALDRTTIIVDGHERAVTPGMVVTAEIKTGRRRVISYLLSPLQRYVHDGLEER